MEKNRVKEKKVEQVVYDHVFVGMNEGMAPYLQIMPEFYTEISKLFEPPDDEELRRCNEDRI